MKLNASPSRVQRGAFALMLVLIFTAISMMYLGAAMSWTSSTANLNERNNQYQSTLLAAEAASEKIVGKMFEDFKNYGQAGVSGNLSSVYPYYLPSSSESAYWSDYEFSNAQGSTGRVYVGSMGSSYFVQNLGSTYAGLGGTRLPFKVVVNARNKNARFAVTNAAQQEVSFTTIPIFQFAIFYQGLMEYTKCATMDIKGRVHSNSSIYYGCFSGSSLTFREDVSAVGTIQQKDWWDVPLSSQTGGHNFMKAKTSGAASMTLPIGTNNSSAAIHKVIEKPDAAESPTSAMGKERYYNKAQIVILVSNSTMSVSAKVPFSTTSNNITPAAAAFFINTNSVSSLYDDREDKYQMVTSVDIGKFTTWAATNTTVTGLFGSGTNNTPNLIYVADYRTGTGKNQAVRLTNGLTLPSRGLTIASPNGVYVQGNYNCPTAAHLGTTNTSNTKPSSIVADGVTILSTAWSDASSASAYTSRAAASTTVNAAIISGNVKSLGTTGTAPMSGGPHNLPRLLETWSGDTLTINGSLICLYESTKANSNFIHPGYTGQYYVPPTRNWTFDQNFLNPALLPPGTPAITALERMRWVIPPVNNINYAGY